ncbi:MAG: hypothetical protein ACFFAO_17495, partial [Candidatus Hermodarchaeota archaeon]
SLPFVIYVLLVLIIVFIFALFFGIESLKSENPEIRLKGKFLLLAWSSYISGALLDAGIVPISAFALIIVRVLLISSAIEFYFSFFLPKWAKDLLNKVE